jgi:hypothetical protein
MKWKCRYFLELTNIAAWIANLNKQIQVFLDFGHSFFPSSKVPVPAV